MFLAAPLFSEAERDFNSKVARSLREEGFDVWLAQEHGLLEKNSNEGKQSIFKDDLDALKKSDVVLAVLDGVDVDAGVAFETGFAHALGKPMVGLKTDYRVFSKVESINLMLEVPMIAVCRTLRDTIECLRKQSRHEKSPIKPDR